MAEETLRSADRLVEAADGVRIIDTVVTVRMKGSSRRPEQVAETVRQVVADALLTEVRDPAGRVRHGDRRDGHQRPVGATRDRVSVMGDDADKDTGARGTGSAAGFLRGQARPRR